MDSRMRESKKPVAHLVGAISRGSLSKVDWNTNTWVIHWGWLHNDSSTWVFIQEEPGVIIDTKKKWLPCGSSAPVKAFLLTSHLILSFLVIGSPSSPSFQYSKPLWLLKCVELDVEIVKMNCPQENFWDGFQVAAVERTVGSLCWVELSWLLTLYKNGWRSLISPLIAIIIEIERKGYFISENAE